jgi:hypothetical protein
MSAHPREMFRLLQKHGEGSGIYVIMGLVLIRARCGKKYIRDHEHVLHLYIM